MKPDFVEAMKLEPAAPMPPAVEARLRARLDVSQHQRSHWWRYPAVALVSCALGMALVVTLLPRTPPAPTELGGFKVELASTSVVSKVEGNQLSISAGAVTLSDEAAGATVHVERPSTLRREARGLRVLQGSVELTVKKRPDGAEPMRVLVSSGEIEVRGTRFLVDQHESSGEVKLFEGSIIFRSPTGREVELKPGGTLHWPIDELPPLPIAPPEVAPADPSLAADVDAVVPPEAPKLKTEAEWAAHDRLMRAHTLLERIPRLLDEHKTEQAAAELTVAMKQDLPASARERLSFMLIEVLANQLWDQPRACRQVKDHLWRYPAGRYDDEVDRIRTQLACR